METDLLPLSSVFAASFVLFFYFSLLQHYRSSANLFARDGRFSRWLLIALTFLKHGCVIALALSGLALVSKINGLGWWTASLLALGILVLVIAVERITAWSGMRRLNWALWPRVAQRNAGSGQNGSSRGPNVDESYAGGFTGPEEPVLTEEELINLDQRDREMLRSILRLDVTDAHEIMVPRLDMVAVDTECSIKQVADAMVKGGHSRLPVYEQTEDRIVGIVHSREVLASLASAEPTPALGELLHPAFFIPETKRLDDLLEEMLDRGVQMAIVVDEYGGTEGLVTMEDLLEEIVGEIEDEFSKNRESELVHMPDGTVVVNAGISTTDIEELFATKIESDDVDTVGGYVYQTLGRIPQVGDSVTTDHLKIEVISIMGRRLRKLKVSRVNEEDSS
ncbi:MAG: HlyC/CorC family transporter [Chloroflexi bacterium]|nr:HlyC/CorC family transporter [Chloroflexota bacterium]